MKVFPLKSRSDCGKDYWLPYTDQEKEGEWLNEYTKQKVSLNRFYNRETNSMAFCIRHQNVFFVTHTINPVLNSIISAKHK